MIIRVVRIRVNEGRSEEFLRYFFFSKATILKSPGCTHVELLRDLKDPNCYISLSHWETDRDLEMYQHSETFKSIWIRIKPLFSEKPFAFSCHKLL